MNSKELIDFAKSQVLAKDQLEEVLFSLKQKSHSMLECMLFVKYNQNISLNEAMNFVIDSKTWFFKKNEFIQHQNEMWEEISESENFKRNAFKEVDSINLTLSENDTQVSLHLKNESKK